LISVLRILGNSATMVIVGGLIIVTWTFTLGAIDSQRRNIVDHVEARVTNQAVTFAAQVGRQILFLEQSLRVLRGMWESDPARFDLRAQQARLSATQGLSRDVLLVDETGIVRQATIPEAVGQSVVDRDFFRNAFDDVPARGRLFMGSASIDPIFRSWHMNVALALRNSDGSFAGLLVTDYRTQTLADIFGQTNVDENGLVALIGLSDGLIRAAVGPTAIDPDASQRDTPMHQALTRQPDGLWIGVSAPDSVIRVHAFREVGGRDIAVVVGMDHALAMRPTEEWAWQAYGYAGGITTLLLLVAAMTLRASVMASRRQAAIEAEKADMASANRQLEILRREADDKTIQLEATLRGMTDGVAMVDGNLCLVEWNARFADIAGVPVEVLRIGTPMADILRAQAQRGEFGPVDVEAEVARRIERLRTVREGVTQRRAPDGRMIELRRNFLPDGGFVTVYSDITAQKAAEEALQAAKRDAETANAAKSRFVAVVSHEIRTPLSAMLNALALLDDGTLPRAQAGVLETAKAAGDALASLVNDILELSRAESGNLTLRPTRFAARELLEATLEVFHAQAAARGITFRLTLDDDLPAPLLADAARLRQILLNLLSNSVKFAAQGEVSLIGWMERRASPGLGLMGFAVRDRGPVIAEDDRQRLFQPFSRLDGAENAGITGSGLGLSICQSLADAMGGAIGCETWQAPDGVEGNSFWLVIPVEIPDETIVATTKPEARPDWYYVAPEPVTEDQLRRGMPRTRVLLVEDVEVNRMNTATMLRRDGHLVDTAADGTEAVRAAMAAPYDLILMDIFMPVMGGREATRQIRALGGPYAHVPILALTGETSEAAFAEYQADGMNAVLAKPASVEALRAAINLWIWAPRRPATAPPRDPPAATTEVTADVDPLDQDRIEELRSNLSPSTYAELVEECLTDLLFRMPALRSALTAANPPAIVAQAHSMQGVAASYGMRTLEQRLRGIVRAAQAGDHNVLGPETAPDIAALINRSGEALRATITREPA
jgi:signal transduction histidine kinase/CheY-like chemotaxis protein